GRGDSLGEHAARFHSGAASGGGHVGVLQGTMSYVLQDPNGQIATTHSISAGLDYSAIGPEHAFLHDTGRAEYTWVSDSQALEGFQLCAKLEGIIPALETSHAIMPAIRIARELRNGVTLGDALICIAHAKQHIDAPIVLFSYFNPLLKFGEGRLANEAKQAGVDAVLVTDLVPEEAQPWTANLRQHGLDPIFLVAPTTSDERLARIAQQARGFIYAV